jgi:hypothetical protein
MEIYREYEITRNIYPSVEFVYVATPVEYTGCETVFHGVNVEDLKRQIDEHLD